MAKLQLESISGISSLVATKGGTVFWLCVFALVKEGFPSKAAQTSEPKEVFLLVFFKKNQSQMSRVALWL